MGAHSIKVSVNFDKLSRLEENFKRDIEEEFISIITDLVDYCKENHDWLNRTGRLETSIVGVVFRGGRYADTIVGSTAVLGPTGKNGLSIHSRRQEGYAMGRSATQEVRYTGGQQIAAAILAGAPYAAYIEGYTTKKGVTLHVVSHVDEKFRTMIEAALQRVRNKYSNIQW